MARRGRRRVRGGKKRTRSASGHKWHPEIRWCRDKRRVCVACGYEQLNEAPLEAATPCPGLVEETQRSDTEQGTPCSTTEGVTNEEGEPPR